MKRILFTVCILFPLLAQAQNVPGYLGKRFIASYSLDVVPNLIASVFSNENLNINLRHNINVEYVMDRKFSLGGTIRFMNDKFTYLNSTGYNYSADGTSLGLNLIFYSQQYNPIAPVGNYIKLKLFTTNYTAGLDVNTDSTGNNGRIYKVNRKEQIPGQVYGIGTSFGHNHIVFKRVVLSSGLDIDYNFIKNPAPAPSDGLAADVLDHFAQSSYIYLHFSIGGLLF